MDGISTPHTLSIYNIKGTFDRSKQAKTGRALRQVKILQIASYWVTEREVSYAINL
jgi:hypothetical protein